MICTLMLTVFTYKEKEKVRRTHRNDAVKVDAWSIDLVVGSLVLSQPNSVLTNAECRYHVLHEAHVDDHRR